MRNLKDGYKVVHEFAGGDFCQEVVAAVLDTGVSELGEEKSDEYVL
jgi:hypothetical protein